MTTRRTPIASLLASLTLALPVYAHAAVLGEISSLSAIGAPLRVEIGTYGGSARDIGGCLRVVATAQKDTSLPVISRARISAVGTGPSSRIVISSPETVQHPAAQLTLENTCDSRLRRSYTLLFPFAPTPAQVEPISTRKVSTGNGDNVPANAQRWTTAPGESLYGIARALYPHDDAAQRAFIRAAVRANPTLFPDRASQRQALPAGTTLITPNLARVARESARPPAKPKSAPPATPASRTSAKSNPAPGPVTGDRLVVETADVKLAPARTLSGTTQDIGQREQEVSSAIDRSIVAQMELLARIKELEQIQTRLLEQASQIGVVPPPAPTPPVAPPDEVKSAEKTPPQPPQESGFDWPMLAALGLAGLAIGLMLRARAKRRELQPNEWNASTPTPTAATDTPSRAGITIDTAPATEMPPLTQTATTSAVLPLEWDHTPSGFGPPELAPLAEEEEVEEHDSAIELAEIMMSFGRVHGAAETLADFIRSNPKQAVTPWLKLLEVYRAANLRNEFDALARQLNKTFNVKTVTWDNFDEARSAPDTLEKMPHLIALLEKQWGTRDCQATLQKLLRDNRDGTRQGFPLNVIDEILCLAAILEQQLGPYRAPLEELPDSGPQTEPPPA